MNPLALFVQVWLTRLAKTRAGARMRARKVARTRATRIRARVFGCLVMAGVLVLGPVLAAFADGGAGVQDPWMSSFGIKDSHGLGVSAYSLSIDRGGPTDPGKAVTAFVLGLLWNLYRMYVSIALWLFDWALQFEFIDILAGPLEVVAETLQRTTGQVHPVPMLLTLAGVFCAMWIMSGQAAKGLGGLFVSLTAASLLTTVLANPVAVISGDDGALHMAKDAGISLSSQVLTNGESSSSDPKELRAHTTGALVETFVRLPHQMINYGAIVDDDAKCVEVYDEQLKKNEDADSDDPREAMGDCKESYGEVAERPSSGLTGMVFLLPSGGLLGLLVLVFAIGLILLTALVLFEAALITWQLVKATGFPGSGTTGLFAAVCVMAVSLFLLVAVLFGAGVYLMLLRNVLTQEANFVIAIVILDMFILLGVIVLFTAYTRARSQGRKLGEKLTKGMNSPTPGNVGSGLGKAKTMVSHAAAPMVTSVMHRKSMSPRGDTGPTPTGQGTSPTATPQPRGSKVAALAKGTGKVTVGAAKLGLASTVGAPVYAPRAFGAGKKALQARRDRLQQRFADSKASVADRVHRKSGDAKAFGREYVHNVSTAGRFVGKVSGASKLGGLAAAGMGIDPVSGAAAAAAASTYFGAPKRHTPTPRPETNVRPTPAQAPRGGPTTSSQAPSTRPASTKTPVEMPKMTEKDLARAQQESDRQQFVQRMRERQRQRHAAARPQSTRNIG